MALNTALRKKLGLNKKYTYNVIVKERGKKDPMYFHSSDPDAAQKFAEYYRRKNSKDKGRYSVTINEILQK